MDGERGRELDIYFISRQGVGRVRRRRRRRRRRRKELMVFGSGREGKKLQTK